QDPRWRYGAPPAGNANYGWIQHMLHHLSPLGTMATVLANGSLSSQQNGEGDIRKNLVEKDLVECIVALPPQLFFGTQIPVCLWFLTKNKEGTPNGAKTRKRSRETLFIDARQIGFMETRTVRAFTDDDVNKIADAYHAWRGTDTSNGEPYSDVAGFCRAVTTHEVAQSGYVLTPGRYVGAEDVEDDGEPLDEKIARLTSEIRDGFKKREDLQTKVLSSLDALLVPTVE
ncbi:N-6 DNA methylase, partial [Escherichia coli]|uniref:N-6 DNA methylase n=1 Tax=Escherichia coli TaxID=562 RepID=UPI0032E4EEA1